MKRLKFLIAHENPVFRRIVRRRLEREGFETLLAGSAAEAEALTRMAAPDVVVAGRGIGSVPVEEGRKPVTIVVGGEGVQSEAALARGLRLSQREFFELLQLGPLLVAFLLTLLQNS